MAFNVKGFVQKHKKALLITGAAAAGYFVVWPSLRDGLTQIAGAGANAAGTQGGGPSFVPVYLNPPAPAPPATSFLPAGTPIPGWPNATATGTGGATISTDLFGTGTPINVPLAQPVSANPNYTYQTGPSGFGYVGSTPTAAAQAAASDPGNTPQTPTTPPGVVGNPLLGNIYKTVVQPATVPSWVYGSAISQGAVVTHSLYAEWDPVDPSQRWNANTPVSDPSVTRLWVDDDGYAVTGPM